MVILRYGPVKMLRIAPLKPLSWFIAPLQHHQDNMPLPVAIKHTENTKWMFPKLRTGRKHLLFLQSTEFPSGNNKVRQISSKWLMLCHYIKTADFFPLDSVWMGTISNEDRDV